MLGCHKRVFLSAPGCLATPARHDDSLLFLFGWTQGNQLSPNNTASQLKETSAFPGLLDGRRLRLARSVTNVAYSFTRRLKGWWRWRRRLWWWFFYDDGYDDQKRREKGSFATAIPNGQECVDRGRTFRAGIFEEGTRPRRPLKAIVHPQQVRVTQPQRRPLSLEAFEGWRAEGEAAATTVAAMTALARGGRSAA